MNERRFLLFIAALCQPVLPRAQVSDVALKAAEIRIRDPFILADPARQTYFMYAQSANREGHRFIGVEAYASKDLVNWLPAKPVLELPDDAGISMVWAPEVHAHEGRFYLFVTLTRDRTLPGEKPVPDKNWPPMHARGTHIFRSDSPLGPFKPLKDAAHTPEDWMALDGTLFVDKGTPYMVFCHEWVQVIDGSIDVVQLKDDLSDTIGAPKRLFGASAAPGAKTGAHEGKVTDGCFLHRSPESGKLFMIWSTFIPGSGYCVVLTESASGRVEGPWINQRHIYKENGGHGMLFRSFGGRLLMALHQPNTRGQERLHLFEVRDDGDTLEVTTEITGPPPAAIE